MFSSLDMFRWQDRVDFLVLAVGMCFMIRWAIRALAPDRKPGRNLRNANHDFSIPINEGRANKQHFGIPPLSGARTGAFIGLCAVAIGVLLAVAGRPLTGLALATLALGLIAIVWKRHQVAGTLTDQQNPVPRLHTWAYVTADTTLREIVNFQAIDRGIENYAVKQGDQVRGFLNLKTIKSTPNRDWAVTRAGDVMRPIHEPDRHPQRMTLVTRPPRPGDLPDRLAHRN